MGELPPKLFFRIGEVAGLVGVEPHVLRYWEREFRSIRPTKSAKGQRVYSRKDVENLLRVRDLLYRDGFTIAGAKKKLQRPESSPESSAEESPELGPESLEPSDESPASLDGAEEPAPRDGLNVREKLVALRGEVEAFLVELSSTPR
jgi:DNA-binding transcriptional MerR regulator